MKATMTSKGQVTIPSEIRAKARIVAGTQLDFQLEDEDTIIIHLSTRHISKLKGIVKSKKRKPVSLREMKQAIAESASKKI